MSANAGDTGSIAPRVGEEEVMAAVDRSGTVPTFVIADVSVDDAWLAVTEADALALPEWR